MSAFKGKIALVTGGSRGIGRAVVLKLAAAGATVTFSYVNRKESAREVEETAASKGGSCHAVQSDVTDEKEARDLCRAVVDRWGTLDILVNNAGIIRDKSLLMMETAEWREVMACNLDGVFHVTKAAIFNMLRQKSGSIVNVTSVSALRGVASQSNYSAAKAGVNGFTRSLAMETAPYGVRVNAVAPGFIETDMVSGLTEERLARELDMIPMGRFGLPEEAANLIVFLAGVEASYITGQVFVVDGGATL